jgi:membrane associated rhomboid family serine protease
VAAWNDVGVPMVGASGAIAGVLGAYFLLYPQSRILSIVPIFIFIQLLEIPAWVFLPYWFLMQFIQGAFSSAASGGVAWWAHIGGFLAGMIAVWIFRKPERRPSTYDYFR